MLKGWCSWACIDEHGPMDVLMSLCKMRSDGQMLVDRSLLMGSLEQMGMC